MGLAGFNHFGGWKETRPNVIVTIHRNCFGAGMGAVATKYLRLHSG
jgi:hypothetical protein